MHRTGLEVKDEEHNRVDAIAPPSLIASPLMGALWRICIRHPMSVSAWLSVVFQAHCYTDPI